ncbi:MAG: isoprenylcysteine carboxylmethyltransferase family protein [Acidobacteria bacterium]|nr:isoprenylcysteine carboxylmethyltransferase family protein [Acidobacteriota bacterium]
MEKVRRFATIYFAIQGIAVILWWLLLYVEPAYRSHFQLDGNSQTSLLAFWLPDMVIMAGGSFSAAFLTAVKSRYQVTAMWIAATAFAYSTLYTMSYAAMTGKGWLGVTLMLPATLWSGVFATTIMVGSEMFRAAVGTSTRNVLFKTFAQIAVVWSVVLVVLPYLLTLLEDELGIQRYTFRYQAAISISAFLIVSVLGIWAAYTMSKIGKGTPLPLDHARKMVVSGPYAFVRNPMALSGIEQGLAVALYFGSPLVMVYALIGSAIWQLVFRPLEEDDLLVRFGMDFEEYRREVRCWLPRFSPYQNGKSPDSSNSIERPSGSM